MTNTKTIIFQYKSPVGEIAAESDGKSLTGLYIKNQTGYPRETDGIFASAADCEIFIRTRAWLDCYFSGHIPDFTPPLSLCGTDFQKSVWEKLLAIPYGETTTYGAIAAKTAAERGIKRMSAQAVGNAVGKNPVSIIVPCHRVIGSDGSLTGYNGGIDIKKKLLAIEKSTLGRV